MVTLNVTNSRTTTSGNVPYARARSTTIHNSCIHQPPRIPAIWGKFRGVKYKTALFIVVVFA